VERDAAFVGGVEQRAAPEDVVAAAAAALVLQGLYRNPLSRSTAIAVAV